MSVMVSGLVDLMHFLSGKPAEWSWEIAARSALRVLPLALAGEPATHWMLLLRAGVNAWAAAKYPTHQFNANAFSAAMAAAAAVSAIDHPPYDNRTAADFARLSVASAARAASQDIGSSAATYGADSASTGALAAANSAASSHSDPAYSNANAAWWHEISVCLTILSSTSAREDAACVTNALLWRDDIPSGISDAWRSFSTNEVALSEGYAPWITWYQGLLMGRMFATDSFGPDLTIRIARQPDDWWNRPARDVNADITQWLNGAG